MKKILIIMNGTLISQHLLETGINIAKNTSSVLHAVFLNDSLELAEYNYPFPNDLSLTRNYLTGKSIVDEDAALLASNIRLFEDACRIAKIDFYLDPDREINLDQLKEYSAFSDFILADADQYLSQFHLADLLAGAHCPIYLVSKKVEKVENIILTYDGSFSSIFAIKSFAYIFPEWRNLPTYLVYVNSAGSNELPKEKHIKLWLTNHFDHLQVKILHVEIGHELVSYIRTFQNSLVVMGSFGRSPLSRFFRKSMAHTVVEEGSASLFVRHE